MEDLTINVESQIEHDCEHEHEHDFIELIDEDGNATLYEFLDEFEYEGKMYCVLSKDEEGYVFRIEEKEDETADLIRPEEDELMEILKVYNERL